MQVIWLYHRVRNVYYVKLQSSSCQIWCCANRPSTLSFCSNISKSGITWAVLQDAASHSMRTLRPTLSAGLYLTLSSSTEHTCIKSVVFLVLPSSSLVFLSFVSLDHFCHWMAPLETNPSNWNTDSTPFGTGWCSGTCNSATDVVQGLEFQVSLWLTLKISVSVDKIPFRLL